MTSPVLGTAAEYSPFQCLLLISLGSPNFNRGEADPSYNVHGRGLEDGDIYSRALDARDLDFEDTGLHTRGINADELGYLNKRDLHIRDLLEILQERGLTSHGSGGKPSKSPSPPPSRAKSGATISDVNACRSAHRHKRSLGLFARAPPAGMTEVATNTGNWYSFEANPNGVGAQALCGSTSVAVFSSQNAKGVILMSIAPRDPANMIHHMSQLIAAHHADLGNAPTAVLGFAHIPGMIHSPTVDNIVTTLRQSGVTNIAGSLYSAHAGTFHVKGEATGTVMPEVFCGN